MADKQSYIYASHKNGVLDLIMTQDLEDKVLKPLKEIDLMAVLQAERSIEDVETESETHCNCIHLKITISEEDIYPFFEAWKMVLRQSIQDSISHNDN